MLRFALLTPDAMAANSIQHVAHESGVFKLILRGEPLPPLQQIIRTLTVHKPELVLLDLNDWDCMSRIARTIKDGSLGGVTIGFKTAWSRMEQLEFQDAGIV